MSTTDKSNVEPPDIIELLAEALIKRQDKWLNSMDKYRLNPQAKKILETAVYEAIINLPQIRIALDNINNYLKRTVETNSDKFQNFGQETTTLLE